MRTILTFLFQEAYRPRHARRDLMADMTVPATLGVPSWLPVVPSPAQKALAQAEAEVRHTMESLYRRHLLHADLHGAVRELHYAEGAVTSR